MILYLDTSSMVCRVWIDDKSYSWESGRGLAKGLLKFVKFCLEDAGGDWSSLTGLGVYEGPGSFTGLRIGATVMNTIADSEKLPIVGAGGEDWREKAQKMLDNGEDQKIVIPEYGGVVNITTPKK